MLILFYGLPGSGKTTIAKAYSEAKGYPHLHSDLIRQELGLLGDYSGQAKQKVYDELLGRASRLLAGGQTVIVDSTFYKAEVRAPFLALSVKHLVRVAWIETTANEENTKIRVSKQRPDSEADFEVYLKLKKEFEPINHPHLSIRTDLNTPIHLLIAQIDQYLATYDK